MAESLRFYFGSDAEILALDENSEKWHELAFYYTSDKTYFYQIVNNEMRRYGAGDVTVVGVGITLNDKVIGGVKTLIEENDILNIPENWDYNTFSLSINGVINCSGQINIM